jgi:hypothetical protein
MKTSIVAEAEPVNGWQTPIWLSCLATRSFEFGRKGGLSHRLTYNGYHIGANPNYYKNFDSILIQMDHLALHAMQLTRSLHPVQI